MSKQVTVQEAGEMDAEEKDAIFRNPPPPELCLDRNISTVFINGTLWAAVQTEKDKKTGILIGRFTDKETPYHIYVPGNRVHRPCIFSKNGQPTIVWNEHDDGKWNIRIATIDTSENRVSSPRTVHSSPELCLPPTACTCNGYTFVTWAGRSKSNLVIHSAREQDNGNWEVDTPFENHGADCFRPSIASTNNSVAIAWDEYSDGKYRIAVARYENDGWSEVERVGADGERWLASKVVADADGFYLTWTVMKTVRDKLGIVDNAAFAMMGLYRNGKFELLYDEDNAEDRRIIADLREGLLAKNIYKGHVGLRRNPQINISADGELRLFWERREETEGSSVTSHLCGRQYLGGGEWSTTRLYSSNGYCYAIPHEGDKSETPVTLLNYHAEGKNLLSHEWVKYDTPDEFPTSPNDWKRWQSHVSEPAEEDRHKVSINGEGYSLFWADTHCHSNFSPDAEGEVDELVHFARDVAGLDAVTIIDNDYYPHKALTETEWRVQQDLADHFTHPGEFIYMPGYEFTCHRNDLEPDFNHRCVIFPKGEGPLLRRIDSRSDTDEKLASLLKETEGMAYPHHCSYKLINPTLEWNVEVCSSWRLCLEETDFTIEQLKAGWKIGFIGSSDTHRAVPGLGGARTGLYARELTPEALLDAYRNRRCIATQGCNICADFRVNDAFIGGSSETDKAPRISVHVRAPQELDYIEVLRDGDVIFLDMLQDANYNIEFEDTDCPPGEHFYFLKIKLVGDPSFNVEGRHPVDYLRPFSQNSRYPHNLARARGPFAWTSPVWVTKLKGQ